MATPLTDKRKARLQDAILQKSEYSVGATQAMQHLATGRLNKWLGEEDKRDLYRALFGVGTSKVLTGKQVSALLDWMAMQPTLMGDQYIETPASVAACEEMNGIIAEFRKETYMPLPGFENVK